MPLVGKKSNSRYVSDGSRVAIATTMSRRRLVRGVQLKRPEAPSEI